MEAGLFGGEGLEVGFGTGLGLPTRAGLGAGGGGAATERTPAGDPFTEVADASNGERWERGAGGGGGGGYDREGEEGEMDAVAVTEGELAAGKLVGEAATTRAYTASDVTVTVS